MNAVLARRRPDPRPGAVALLVGDALYLVKSRDRIPHVRRVDKRLFPLLGKGELRVRQAILLRGAQTLGAAAVSRADGGNQGTRGGAELAVPLVAQHDRPRR